MSRIFARSCLAILVIMVAAFYLPQLYKQLFFPQVEKTHLFYSPVARQFIYKEKIVGTVPDEVQQKSEEQINAVAYRSEDGRWLHRLEFERLLPFIYYKDMEVRGLLPIEIDGQTFTKKEIKASRRVLELRAREMDRPQTAIYPLFVSTPRQARLVFPKERFYWQDRRLIFVNATTNREDSALSREATALLKNAGLQFPPVKAFGNFTVLKPFDIGVFLLDSAGHLFHLQRNGEDFSAVALSLPLGVEVDYIRVAESRRSPYCGIVVGKNNELYLMAKGNQRSLSFVPLPITGYNRATMDLKIIFNPLYTTIVFADNRVIYGVALDKNFTEVSRFQHRMSCAKMGNGERVFQLLFPFTLEQKEKSSVMDISVHLGKYALIGMLLSACAYICSIKLRRQSFDKCACCMAFFFGIYGLLVLFCVDISSSIALSSIGRKGYNKEMKI